MNKTYKTATKYAAGLLGGAAWIMSATGGLAGDDKGGGSWTEPLAVSDPDPWHVVTGSYLWASGLEGDMTIAGITIDVDLGFGDILDTTKYGFAQHLELRKSNYGFYVTPSYAKLEGGGQAPRRTIEFAQDFWMVEAGGFYTLVDTQDERPFTLDLMVGLRYLNVDTDVDIVGRIPGVMDLKIGSSTELYDPVIGFRAQKYLSDKWLIGVRGDIGGFGISDGNTSDLSWQAMGLLAYEFNDRYLAFGGYRGLGIDTSEGSGISESGFDLTMHGIILGLRIVW